MKKWREIPEAWGNAEPGDSPWEKDELIARLKHEGHHPISVSRAVVTVEQCDEGDENMGGWCHDPLRITVYPDPDAGFGSEPCVLYVHAGRSGLMDMYSRPPQGETQRLVGLNADQVRDAQALEDLRAVRAIRNLVKGRLHGGYLVTGAHTLPDGRSVRTARPGGKNAELVRLGEEAVAAIDRYEAALTRIPNLFEGFERTDV